MRKLFLFIAAALVSTGLWADDNVFTFPTSGSNAVQYVYALTGTNSSLDGNKLYYSTSQPAPVSENYGIEATKLGLVFKPSENCKISVKMGNNNSSAATITAIVYKIYKPSADTYLYPLYTNNVGKDAAAAVLSAVGESAASSDVTGNWWKNIRILKYSSSKWQVDASYAKKTLSGETVTYNSVYNSLFTATTLNAASTKSDKTKASVQTIQNDGVDYEFQKDTMYLIYCNRSTSNVGIFSVTFEAAASTYEVTYEANGHGTAPAATEASSVTLEEITGVSEWAHTGWKANVVTKVGNDNVAANTLIANGTTVTLLENTIFTAQWEAPSAAPTITSQPSTSAAEYLRGETAAALSVEATSSAGTLSYQWYSNTEAATTGENLVEIDGATNASYTPSTATLGTLYYFCAVTNTEEGKAPTTINSKLSGAITVVTNPLGEHTLTWTVRVENSEKTITTTDKNPTSTHLGSMSNIAINGALTVDNTGKNGGTGKIQPTNGEKVATNYLSMTFTVADGYTFTPTTYTMSTTAVSAEKTVEVEISDTHGHSKSATWSQPKTTSTPDSHDYDLSGSAYEGVVTLKIYVYNDADNYGYRLGSSIVLAGTVAEKPAAPISWMIGEDEITEMTIYLDKEYTLPTLSNAQSLTVDLASTNESVAVFNAGVLEITGVGNATISAEFDGDDTYKATTASYALNVVEKYPTGVDNTEAGAKAVKSLKNGVLVIEKNGKKYNIIGSEIR